ncbi:hypothetical protein BKA93DRAFT_840967 [Sparassis latifolia]
MQLSFMLSVVAGFAAVASGFPIAVPVTDYCQGTNNTNPQYLCGDYRLGPVVLPTAIPLGNLMSEYDRLGGLCPGEFLKTWTNASTGAYNYPPLAGFQPDTASAPIEGNQTLSVGTRVDRFGSAYGSYVSPAYAPYIQRALPPSNLDTPAGEPTYPYNYHVYEVLKPFVVLSGPIAPWFGQPGQGTQYETPMSVGALLNASYLKELTREEY